ncbi:hypothetical protein EJ06DRAFT_204708 [Trichodelitschia bisporula]|uniref:Mid2 domain-containing protein n=1 Tax=Trichodelitschia bisporula TaxID=703511 RepID=A0A6G1I8W9_9PEZI|nr:hypothetical protein EJ06DRAFT_204708 [Trichodelitschia bisporula]
MGIKAPLAFFLVTVLSLFSSVLAVTSSTATTKAVTKATKTSSSTKATSATSAATKAAKTVKKKKKKISSGVIAAIVIIVIVILVIAIIAFIIIKKRQAKKNQAVPLEANTNQGYGKADSNQTPYHQPGPDTQSPYGNNSQPAHGNQPQGGANQGYYGN